jgi:arginine N-succinyltransferase
VAPATAPVRHLLEKIGFEYVSRIDPFDGGPHYEAPLAEVALVRAHRTARLSAAPLAAPSGPAHLVAREAAGGRHRFRAVVTPVRHDAAGLHLPADARRALGARAGDLLHHAPFD